MVSLLDAVPTTRFAKTTQHDTSKVQRLPRKMTMKTATHLLKTAQKVLRLPHWHVTKDVWLSPSAPTQMTTFADTLPADPQSEPGTLATHSGILIYLWHLNGRSPCGHDGKLQMSRLIMSRFLLSFWSTDATLRSHSITISKSDVKILVDNHAVLCRICINIYIHIYIYIYI